MRYLPEILCIWLGSMKLLTGALMDLCKVLNMRVERGCVCVLRVEGLSRIVSKRGE